MGYDGAVEGLKLWKAADLIESQQATITEQANAIVKCVRDEWNPLPVATDEIALDWFLQEYAALKEESCESG